MPARKKKSSTRISNKALPGENTDTDRWRWTDSINIRIMSAKKTAFTKDLRQHDVMQKY